MIFNFILIIVNNFLKVLLAPLNLINITVDFVSSITVFNRFMAVAYYILPWNNIAPLFAIVVGIFIFRAFLALINLIWHFIPIVGN